MNKTILNEIASLKDIYITFKNSDLKRHIDVLNWSVDRERNILVIIDNRNDKKRFEYSLNDIKGIELDNHTYYKINLKEEIENETI